MSNKSLDIDLEGSDIESEALTLVDHKWTILFRNGAKLEFMGGYNKVGSTLSPSDFLQHVEDFHSKELVPSQQASGQRMRYRFPRYEVGSSAETLSIDIREVLAVHVSQKNKR